MEMNNNERYVKTRDIRNSLLYLSATLTSNLGSNIYIIAISLYILNMTGSGVSFAVNMAISYVPRILLGAFSGVLADRVSKKILCIVLDFLSGICIIGLLLVANIWGLKIEFLYITSFILSIISTFYGTALTSSLPSLVSKGSLGRINSISQLSSSISSILGAVIGGIIYGFVPINLFLMINCISFFISAGVIKFLNFEPNKNASRSLSEKNPKFSLFLDIKEMFQMLKKLKIISITLKISVLYNFIVQAGVLVMMPFMANRVLKLSSAEFGLIEGSLSLGIMVSSILLSVFKNNSSITKSVIRSFVLIGIIIALFSVPSLLMNLLPKAALTIIMATLVFLLGFVIILLNVPLLIMVQRETPPELLGRIFGFMTTVSSLSLPFGLIMFGLLTKYLDSVVIFCFIGIFSALTGVVLAFMKDFKDTDASEEIKDGLGEVSEEIV